MENLIYTVADAWNYRHNVFVLRYEVLTVVLLKFMFGMWCYVDGTVISDDFKGF